MVIKNKNTSKVSLLQVNRTKSSVKWYKTLLSRTKQLIKSLLLVSNDNFDH